MTVVDATDAKVVAHLLDRLAVVVEVVLCVVVAVFGGRNGSHGTVECILDRMTEGLADSGWSGNSGANWPCAEC